MQREIEIKFPDEIGFGSYYIMVNNLPLFTLFRRFLDKRTFPHI